MASESVCARVTSSSIDNPEASEPARWTTDEPCFDLADQAELLGAFTQQEPGHGLVLAVAFADPVPDPVEFGHCLMDLGRRPPSSQR